MANQTPENTQRGYRRGAVMGITMAEAFVLICFALLLLFAFWQWEIEQATTPETVRFSKLSPATQKEILAKPSPEITAFGKLTRQQQEALLQKNPPEIEAFTKLSPAQRALVISSIEDDTLTAFIKLKENGVDFSKIAVNQNSEGKWRFVNKADAERLLDAAAALPEDLTRSLAELVEAENIQDVLRQMKLLDDLVAKGKSLEDISKRFEDVETQREILTATLQKELGAIVKEVGGKFDSDGAIILPETILFEPGSSEPKSELLRFLSQACEPWLSALRNVKTPISEIRIEGHASSEWTINSTAEQAYLNNLALSGQRSEVVLRKCLEFVKDPQLREWSRNHLIAVGYSSTNPILNGEIEDKSASRRVVFAAIPDRETLLDEIESELKRNVSGYDRTLFSGQFSSSNLCADVRQKTLKVRSNVDTTSDSENCRIQQGSWRDTYSGATISDASSLEIDHLVPLKWAWNHGANQWPSDLREAFYSDPKNLRITQKRNNAAKSDKDPTQWLPPLNTAKCTYIQNFDQIASNYNLLGSQAYQAEISRLLEEHC